NQMEPLSRLYRVVAYSRRNHYPNPWSDYPSDYSLTLEKDDLAGLTDGLGLGRVHLVGSSLGGTIAALLARDDPRLVGDLVLYDPALRALVQADAGLATVNEHAAKVNASAREGIAMGRLEEGARSMTDLNAGEGAFDALPPPIRSVILQNTRPLLGELMESPQPFTCADAGRIGAATLLMNGERSAPLFREITGRLAQCIPQSESVVVPGASHAAYRQNPQFFNEAITTFLTSHKKGSG
ncbi:MAG: alpha/beta hydrolase, partial [Nitrososphaerales archaeon]